MTNAQIIFNNSMELMKAGTIGTTGRTFTYETENGEKVTETAEGTRRNFYTDFGWEGSRYDGSLDIAQISKIVRAYIKEKYPTWKFSAKISRYSIGQSMRVECKESPVKIYKTAEDLEAEGLTEHIKTTDYNGETFEYDTYNKEIQDNIMRLRQNQYFDLDSWTDADYLSAYAEAVKVSKFHAIKTELFESVCEDVKAFVESYNYHDCDGMIDYFESAVTLKRIEICDLLLACLAAKELSNDGGEKWIRLYKNLKEQLDKLDAQLDEIS